MCIKRHLLEYLVTKGKSMKIDALLDGLAAQ